MTGVIRRGSDALTYETRPMSGPKFRPGQVVEFLHGDRVAPRGTYEIVRLMPSETGEPQYRVRSLHEAHERIAWEHELRAVDKR
jgi:hypothetical protein